MPKQADHRAGGGTTSPDFTLTLADGTTWDFSAESAVRRQLGILGRVMTLRKDGTGGGARIIFLPSGTVDGGTLDDGPPRDAGLPAGLPGNGWKPRAAGQVTCWYHAESPDAICEIPPDMTPEVLYPALNLSLAPLYRHAIRQGGFPVHGALVEREERGYLLSGPSQQGKSTCCSRLPRTWNVLCDEQALVLRTSEGEFHAHPLPTWNNFLGKGDQRRWKTERAVPLAGIFFLQKAPKDVVEPLERARAAVLLYDAAMYKYRFAMAGAAQEEIRAERGALFGSTCDAAQRIASFTLRVSLHGKFWEEMENVLKVEEVSVEGNPVFKG
ncbi:MAG: SynChlorMet cassette protein ScmC [Methanomicrobiales archaeon]|nr:SynChlorMet cassette protein ScmC [Methanomicrobiales archaeon]